MKLNDLAIKYKTDKKIPDGIKCQNGLYGHGYTEVYERLLNDLDVKKMLEIGVSYGGSIKMWDEYFNHKAKIVGVDICEKRFKKEDLISDTIDIRIGDATDFNFLHSLKDEYDLIIDDGSHNADNTIVSFLTLIQYLRKGGLYIIEDCHVQKKIFEYFVNKELYCDNKLLVIRK